MSETRVTSETFFPTTAFEVLDKNPYIKNFRIHFEVVSKTLKRNESKLQIERMFHY